MNEPKENTDLNKSLQDTSLQFDELIYGELEQSLEVPAFEFSSPISSISSNCSSPDNTIEHLINGYDGMEIDDSSEFVSLEELRSQISPPSDEECSTLTQLRKSALETIYEDTYLETPPSTPNNPSTSTTASRRKRRLVRTDLSKTCDEFKENVQKN